MPTDEPAKPEAGPSFSLSRCPACGGDRFHQQTVLWPELIAEWELAPEEVRSSINNRASPVLIAETIFGQ
ncbi:hypothetical protein BH18VER2_BH18VER2_04750 [soil metagenome]|nr:hypothetical protein [Chthoniobacterales bacterium]